MLACGDRAAGDPAGFGGRVAIRGRAPGAGASPRQARGTRLRAAQQPARLPPGIASVLSVLSSSAVVLDSNDRVLRASAAARAFGMVKGDRLMVTELAALARQVRRDGEIREGEFEVPVPRFGGRTTSFAVRVAPLGAAVGGGGLVLVLAEDQTESRRVEEVRRDFVANTSHELKTPVGALALLVLLLGNRRTTIVMALPLVMAVMISFFLQRNTHWSPYYKITLTPAERPAAILWSRPPTGAMVPSAAITPVAARSTPPVTSPGNSRSR